MQFPSVLKYQTAPLSNNANSHTFCLKIPRYWTRWLGSFPPWIGECRRQSCTTFSEGMDLWNTLPPLKQLWITSVMGRVTGCTLSNSYSLKTPPTSTIGNFTLRTRCQSSKMPTAHLFLHLVDFGTALSTQSSYSLIVFGKRNLPSAMEKAICKSLQVHNAFGIQIWCNAKLLDN